MYKQCIYILVYTCVAGTAHAEFMDGNRLLSRIRGEPHEFLQALGYITGVFDATRGYVHCSPDNVTAGQITDMMKTHLESAPSVRHLPADQHVAYVMKKTWPCAEK